MSAATTVGSNCVPALEDALNFRGVPLDLVLNYLSEAAGYIIVLDTQVRGKVDVWSNTPVSKEEAINILNSVLSRNGLAAIHLDAEHLRFRITAVPRRTAALFLCHGELLLRWTQALMAPIWV